MKWMIVDLLGGKITGGIQGNQNSHGVSFILGTSKMMDASADVDIWHVAGAFDSTKKMGGGGCEMNLFKRLVWISPSSTARNLVLGI